MQFPFFKLNSVLVGFSLSLVVISCTPMSTLLSPYQANTHFYKAQPLLADSVKSKTYVSAALSFGKANEQNTDNVAQLHMNVHRTFSFQDFTGFVGANVMAGMRNIGTAEWSAPAATIDHYNSNAGAKSTFGTGIDAGLAIVVPFGKYSSEWRVLGVETAIRTDFGGYRQFRKKQAHAYSIVNHNDLSPVFISAGLSTELVFCSHSQVTYTSIKAVAGYSMLKVPHIVTGSNTAPLRPSYFSGTLALGNRKKDFIIFLHANMGTYSSLQGFGFSRSINRKK